MRKKLSQKLCIIDFLCIFASLLFLGVLAHLARALDWQSKGGEFESRMLHFFNDKMKVCETGIDVARNFVIWLSESYIPEVEKTGILQNPRLTHILSHKEQDSECFSLQWEVEDTAALHRWHTQQGMHLNEEMMKIFKDKVVGFPTLMEVIK